MTKFLVEGLDALGKDTLINGIQHKLGYHQVLHYSKPEVLEYYSNQLEDEGLGPMQAKMVAFGEYQRDTFRTMFSILSTPHAPIICNRAHLGECVYAPLYRTYSGDYVFEFEKKYGADQNHQLRLVLLTEDFEVSKHFVDDGESFDITKREKEQELFLAAFEKSKIPNKRIVCVTDQALGGFRQRADILQQVLQ